MKLLITEKFKQGLNIAKALGDFKIKNKKVKNKNLKIIVAKDAIIVPLTGHIFEYDTPKEISKWTFDSVTEILRRENGVIKKLKDDVYKEIIKEYGKHCKEIIIATDSDEEGENIGLEIIEILNKNNINKPVKRLWLTTTIPSDIIRSLKNLRKFNKNLALSVESRRKIDAIIGFSGTRELTLRYSKHKHDIFSFGRVQTSTLWLIIQREKEIKNFIPKKYWQIKVKVGNTFFTHISDKIFLKEEALKIYNKIKDSNYILIKNIEEENKIISPPKPLNTNLMLEISSRILEISPQKIANLAENLYQDGIITYPRVENQTYSESFNQRLNLLRLKNSLFKDYVDYLIKKNLIYPTKGKYEEDHEPITPIKGIKSYKDKKAYELYEIILKHYLATLSENAIFIHKKVKGEINGEIFIAEGEKILKKGFYEIYHTKPFIKEIQDFKENLKYKISKVYFQENETKPPPRYSESTLLSKMEEVGIGTKSTRPLIIETLKERKYIVKKKRTLYPTEKGNQLIEKIEKVWKDYISPEFTARVQKDMEKITKGKKDWNELVKEEREAFYEAIIRLRNSY